MINFKVQNLCLSKDLNEILCELDKKISKLAKDKLNSIRYDVKCTINYNKFYILTRYKQILLLKINNSPCICNYNIDDIISVVKQYLTSGKILKFTTTEVLDIDFNSLQAKPAANTTVNYKMLGDVNVFNSTSVTKNNYVSDEWDQIDW